MNDQQQAGTSSPALFEDNSLALQAQGDAAAVARATQEIQAALVIAKRFERDEIKVKAKILSACKRPELAEVAEYEYSRGGTRITGPTIDLLRAIANRWGNIRYGWTEVERRDGVSSVRCFAWDMQTNGQAERTFSVKHWRDTSGGGYALKDERDIYEMLANAAARRVRACLEEVIDSDVITAAVDQCRLTLKGTSKLSLKDQAVQMVAHFEEFGVTQAMLETRIGNKLDAVSDNQMASLRRVWKSLKDGVGKREDYFKQPEVKPEFAQQDQAGAMGEKLSGKNPGEGHAFPINPTPQPEPAPEPEKRPAQPTGFQPVKALRNLLTMSGIKEGQLLDYLSANGVTDGSVGSIEELAMSNPAAARSLCDTWQAVSAQIKAAPKGD